MLNNDPDSLKKLLDKAKIGLMSKEDSVFFTTIMLSMQFVWDDTHPTAYTDGLTLGFNPDFFLSLTPEERIGVLTHEASHVAYMHVGRKGDRIHWIFNEAADHVINLMLLERGFKLPSFGLADKRFKGMGTEQVYDILFQEMPTSPRFNPLDDLREPADMDEQEHKKQIDDIIIRATLQSSIQGDKAGTVPNEIEIYLKRLLNPKLPWQTILRQWLKAQAKSNYTWKAPNRRYMPTHYLPSLKSEGAMIDFQVFVDISGSETEDDFLRFISELNGIMKMMKPKNVWLGQFDTCIKSITRVRSIMELAKVKFMGRGGTCITDVLNHAEKTKPKVCMIFTDGEFRMDRKTCTANILWVIHDDPKWTAPFGKIVHYNTHD